MSARFSILDVTSASLAAIIFTVLVATAWCVYCVVTWFIVYPVPCFTVLIGAGLMLVLDLVDFLMGER